MNEGFEFKSPRTVYQRANIHNVTMFLTALFIRIKLYFFIGHPHFFNQLSCGLDLVSMAGEWVTATANTNMFTYEIAPVFILMEHVVMEKMRSIIGWETGDSILAPGHNNFNFISYSIR